MVAKAAIRFNTNCLVSAVLPHNEVNAFIAMKNSCLKVIKSQKGPSIKDVGIFLAVFDTDSFEEQNNKYSTPTSIFDMLHTYNVMPVTIFLLLFHIKSIHRSK